MSLPDGTPRKLLNSERLTVLGWSPKILLNDGISKTVQTEFGPGVINSVNSILLNVENQYFLEDNSI